MRSTLPFWGALTVIILMPLLLVGCSSFRANDESVLEEVADAPVELRMRHREIDGWSIRYLESVSPRTPQVVLIHGAPGSLDSFAPYFRDEPLATSVRLTAPDRPGYGYSDYGRIVTEVREQARLLRPLIEPGAIIVGHSYGGTVAARLGMDYPELVGGLVLVSASVSPEHERIFFFNGPMEWPLLNWMLSPGWRLANAEKVTRVAELREMEPLWSRIRVPVTVIHGTEDELVPYEHARYAVDRLSAVAAELITLEGEGHFILWSEVDLIRDAILDLAATAGQ